MNYSTVPQNPIKGRLEKLEGKSIQLQPIKHDI